MTVIRRDFNSIPVRSATETWDSIINLLTSKSAAIETLKSVSGLVASIISSEVTSEAPIVISGSCPRLRIYTVFGEDAITKDKVNEDPISFDISDDDWQISLPCLEEDLEWIRPALEDKSDRIKARNYLNGIEVEDSANNSTTGTDSTNINLESFLKS